MGAETVTYALRSSAIQSGLDGLTTVFPGSPLAQQVSFDIMAAIRLANSNNSISVCDNALKLVLDKNPYLRRTVVGGLHIYLPDGFAGDAKGSNNCMTVDSLGRWYLGGGVGQNSKYAAVLRLNPDLTIDTTYGVDGWWLYTGPTWTSIFVQGITIDPATGKCIIGAGTTGDPSVVPQGESAVCMRINTDGTSDPTFNGGVPAMWVPPACGITLGFGVEVQTDSKIVVCGASIRTADKFEVVFATRLNVDGTIDTTFGSGGSIVTDCGGNSQSAAWAVRIDSSNRAFLGGSTLVKQQSTVSATSGPGNVLYVTAVQSMTSGMALTIGSGATKEAVLAQIISTGQTTVFPKLKYVHNSGELITWQFNEQLCIRIAGGVLDTAFNGTGYNATLFGVSDSGFAVALQSSGKPIVAGGVSNNSGNGVLLTRYNENGTLDTGFGNMGDGSEQWINSIGAGSQAVWCQPDDKIVTADISGPTANPISITRFNANGSIDASFGNAGVFYYPSKPSQWLSGNGIAVNPISANICVSGPTADQDNPTTLDWAAGMVDTTGTLVEG